MKHTNLTRKCAFGLIASALIAIPMIIGIPEYSSARENVGMGTKKSTTPSVTAACAEATAQTDLTVNNVRCRILMGDMWWDLTNAVYEIPKGSGLHSIFAGSLWIGGIDVGGQLKVAGQTYRQTGNDFWPGPLDTSNASVDIEVCSEYDKHFRITRKEVEEFVTNGKTTPAITNWPGNGDKSKGQANYLAPFFDKDGDGIYNPSAGDYPGYDLISGDSYGDCQQVNCIPVDQLFGDETIWWVFNDKGNIHTETKGEPIGLEIRAQAFGFFTDDEINNMTFYNYRIFNRSTFQVDSCYFGVWTDADLGCYDDDYVGCDVKRGLGYTYNGDEYDDPQCQTSRGYLENPPAVGIDFFRGPLADKNDGKDNDRDCLTDTTSNGSSCEQIIMSGFLYYDNTNGVPYGNPSGAVHFYNYLRMRWGDGVPVTYGANGYNSGGPVCNFMYPGNPTTDEHDWGIGGNCSTTPTLADWDEVTAGNLKYDRRMLQSAGPFTLLPGAVNVITTGVVWARATAGGAQASVKLLKVIDDKAQALFDNCFRVLDGPTAPDVTVQELDKEIVLYLSNTNPNSNNYNENYLEFDPLISLTDSNGNACPNADKYYHFQGYKVYQLKSATASANDLEDPNNARLVYQCDLKDNIGTIINYEFDQSLGGGVPKQKVEGANMGLSHSIKITADAFTGGPLINHKSYYFMALAYGFNEYKKYQQDMPPGNSTMCNPALGATTGQKKSYKQGRKNLQVYSAIPHLVMPYTGGTEAHGKYGDGPSITRIEGNGNGGMNLEFTSATTNDVFSSADSRVKNPTYEYGKGPVNIKVIDPLNVPDGHRFTLKFDSVNLANSSWTLINNTTQDTVYSDKTIKAVNEQLILKWGLSVAIQQIADPGSGKAENNGLLSASMTFSDPSKKWLTGLVDRDGPYNANWIRSGTMVGGTPFTNDVVNTDDDQIFEGVLGGTWAPYRLCWASNVSTGFNPLTYYTGAVVQPLGQGTIANAARMEHLASINVVLTNDKTKWTRSVVLEMCEDGIYSSNTIGGAVQNARKHDYRRAPSVDKQGKKAGDPGYVASEGDYISTTGMGWFPGYALNLETGERLNIAFGENSALTKIAGKAVINYNLRANINYTSIKGGPFKVNETIQDYASSPAASAEIVSDNGSSTMKVESLSGVIAPTDMIVGAVSGAKAVVSTFISKKFIVGETVTGGTSNATGKIVADMSSTSVMVIQTLTGIFIEGEEITSPGGAMASITEYSSSYDFEQNGADMLWNPTANISGKAPWKAGSANPVYGGQHYIYVFGHNREVGGSEAYYFPRYDAGKYMDSILHLNNSSPNINLYIAKIFRDAMWVNIPLLTPAHTLLESDVTIRLRVGKAYKPGYSPAGFRNNLGDTVYTDTAVVAVNKNRPMYTFTTEGIATHTTETELAEEALDLIRVVPNPYYAYSNYETNTLDNRIKITNLPEACTVSIYNLSGTLIRKFKKGEAVATHSAFSSVVTSVAGVPVVTTWDGSLDWDLKNTVGIPISSGIYIVHVEVPGVGEKVVKWFGVMRPIDLDSF